MICARPCCILRMVETFSVYGNVPYELRLETELLLEKATENQLLLMQMTSSNHCVASSASKPSRPR